MIIKVKHNGAWSFFDDVCCPTVRETTNLSEANLNAYEQQKMFQGTGEPPTQIYPFFKGWASSDEDLGKGITINFSRKDTPCQIFTNCETYLLNDNGKTIERIF